ncbi:CHAD domain-containing protein [Sneathiella limimaris]|uniref:CHAD domain-containing protein n=1 Tax=Sneathiella limimaris TaxID=1964213 RepID=UPI00146B4909|nr:CHAD domain-containing protein [Sneathiella limimaris]
MKPQKLPYLDISTATSVEDAARLIFMENLLHLQNNCRLFLKAKDDNALMQIRIATRRIRVALRVFRNYIPQVTAQLLKEEFKYFGQRLGLARDLDVLSNGLLGDSCPVPELEDDYKDLRKRIEKRRDKEFQRMRKKLKSKRFKSLMKHYENWCEDPFASRFGAVAMQDLNEFILETLDAGHQELRLKGEKLEDYTVEDLHELRKYVKRCRYHIRFFASRLKPKVVQQSYDILVPMQDSLGHINDVHVGARLLNEICADVSTKKMHRYLHMNALLLEYLGRQADTEMAIYEGLWGDFKAFEIKAKDLVSLPVPFEKAL